ncbi:Crp/Fnr family transcriptional regulator [Thioclava sp.]|uniref:Crp/Fnr family transcriptional regulator n=1 Tax=Thioclava sp. TaxID=1933450 RepID=UPI003AA96B44
MKDFLFTSKTRDDLHCAEIKAHLQKSIPKQVFETLCETAKTQRFAADSVLWEDGMERPGIGILCQGYLRFQRNGLDGRRQIMGLVVPGDIVGDRVSGRPDLSLEAASDATIYWFDRKVYDDFMYSDSMLRRNHYLNNMAQVERLRWLTVIIGALRPDERLACFLLSGKFTMSWHAQSHDRGVLTLAISRRDIADLLATTPETVCRTLKKFEQEGLIEMIDPVHVRVIDRAGLIQRAALINEPVSLAYIMQTDRKIMASVA